MAKIPPFTNLKKSGQNNGLSITSILGIAVDRQYELNGELITNGTDEISDAVTETCMDLVVDGCYSYMQVTCSV